MQIALEELLLAREEWAEIQREMLREEKVPLISFSMNIPGPVKTSLIIERAFRLGVSLIEDGVGSVITSRRVVFDKCGPRALFSVRGDALEIKAFLVEIEDSHPLGRLFDMDVLDLSGRHLSRAVERGCMICGKLGRACAAGRLHPLSQLLEKTNKIIGDHFLDIDSRRIADMASRALIDEVYTTPKPGLVDSRNPGAHKDMDISHFKKSAATLTPYFAECVKEGAVSSKNRDGQVFLKIKKLGIKAEGDMLQATEGKNTHKGAIFSFGIVLTAIGRLLTPEGKLPTLSRVLDEAKKISRPFIERDLTSSVGETAGERAFLESGARGIRGEAMDGFPTVEKISFPAYSNYLKMGKSKNEAGALTLLHLIANVYDTCLYKRGGEDGVAYAKAYARGLLEKGNITSCVIEQMDKDFTEKNLSAGGCADLLALTYFLFSLVDGGIASENDNSDN